MQPLRFPNYLIIFELIIAVGNLDFKMSYDPFCKQEKIGLPKPKWKLLKGLSFVKIIWIVFEEMPSGNLPNIFQ